VLGVASYALEFFRGDEPHGRRRSERRQHRAGTVPRGSERTQTQNRLRCAERRVPAASLAATLSTR
jgi:hypothetical protein